MKKIKSMLLMFCAISILATGAATVSTLHAASDVALTVSVSTADGLVNALSSTAESITLRGDIEMPAAQQISLMGKKHVDFAGFALTLNGSVIVLESDAIATLTQPRVLQSGANGVLLCKGAARLDVFGGTVSAPNGGKMIQGNTGNALVRLNDTVIDCGESGYAFAKIDVVLSGNTSYTGKTLYVSDASAPYLYDFRSVSVAATPTPDEVDPLDKIELTIQGQATKKKGTGAATALACDILYTLDDREPYEHTETVYTQPFYIHVSRTVRATVAYDAYVRPLSDVFSYDLYPNEPEGIVDGYQTFDDVTISCGDLLDGTLFPDTVSLTLEDGRVFTVLCDWGNIFGEPYYEEGTFTMVGETILPSFMLNPNDEKPMRRVIVKTDGITDFIMTTYDSVQEGKNSVVSGAAVATLSAKGGDNLNYSFVLAEDAMLGADNDRFAVDDNLLRVGGAALSTGTYRICLTASSAGKYKTEGFTLVVKPAATKLIVSNPYERVDWQSVSRVKTATHNHTVNTNNGTGWSDNVSDTPLQRVEHYKTLGYGAVIIADHDYVSYPWGDYTGDMLGIAGSELSKNQHLLSYDCEYWDHRDAGTNTRYTYEENVVNLREAGGFAYLAHPCRNDRDDTHSVKDHQMWYDVVDKYPWIYGMEVLNAGQFTRNHSEGLWDEILSRGMPMRNLWGGASDDAHSNAACGTGWNVLLMGEDEHNNESVSKKLQNGEFYFSTYRVEKGKDDNKYESGDNTPVIENIAVDSVTGEIELTVRGASKIEWITENGRIAGVGKTINVNEAYGTAKYIRARMTGPGGQTLTQPFGLYESEEGLASVSFGKVSFDAQKVSLHRGSVHGTVVADKTVLEDGVTYFAVGLAETDLAGKVQVLRLHDAPDAPQLTAEKITSERVALATIANAEYRLGDKPWQDSPIFEGLQAETEYVFYARIKQTAQMPASAAARLTVTTEKASQQKQGCQSTLSGSVTVPIGVGLLIVVSTLYFVCRRRKHGL